MKGPKSASDGIRPYQISVSVRQKSDRCRARAVAMYLPLDCRCNHLSVPCLAAGRVLGISDCIEQGTGSLQHPLLLTGPCRSNSGSQSLCTAAAGSAEAPPVCLFLRLVVCLAVCADATRDPIPSNSQLADGAALGSCD